LLVVAGGHEQATPVVERDAAAVVPHAGRDLQQPGLLAVLDAGEVVGAALRVLGIRHGVVDVEGAGVGERGRQGQVDEPALGGVLERVHVEDDLALAGGGVDDGHVALVEGVEPEIAAGRDREVDGSTDVVDEGLGLDLVPVGPAVGERGHREQEEGHQGGEDQQVNVERRPAERRGIPGVLVGHPWREALGRP
jgi:hypothetical protein